VADRQFTHLEALGASIRRLRGIVEPLDDTAVAQLRTVINGSLRPPTKEPLR
jgi:hypothetical protein